MKRLSLINRKSWVTKVRICGNIAAKNRQLERLNIKRVVVADKC